MKTLLSLFFALAFATALHAAPTGADDLTIAEKLTLPDGGIITATSGLPVTRDGNQTITGTKTVSGAFIATSTVSLKGYVVDSFAASLLTATNAASMRSLIGVYGSGDSPTFTNATVSGIFTASSNNPNYILSTFWNSDMSGPRMFIGADGVNFSKLTKYNSFTDLVVRDPRYIKLNGAYYMSYTQTTGSTTANSLGLQYSPDLSYWQKVTTPDWSSLFTGTQNAVWEGCWFVEGNSVYKLFSTSPSFSGVGTQSQSSYIAQFYAAGANSTFGSPINIPVPAGRGIYWTFMQIWKEGSTYHALGQSLGSAGLNTNLYIEHATSSSLLSGWTIANANDFAGWNATIGAKVEGGAIVTLPSGKKRVYMTDALYIYYSDSSSSDFTTSTWSTPVSIPPFNTYSDNAVDWVDVVQSYDLQTAHDLAALQSGNVITKSSEWQEILGRMLMHDVRIDALTANAGTIPIYGSISVSGNITTTGSATIAGPLNITTSTSSGAIFATNSGIIVPWIGSPGSTPLIIYPPNSNLSYSVPRLQADWTGIDFRSLNGSTLYYYLGEDSGAGTTQKSFALYGPSGSRVMLFNGDTGNWTFTGSATITGTVSATNYTAVASGTVTLSSGTATITSSNILPGTKLRLDSNWDGTTASISTPCQGATTTGSAVIHAPGGGDNSVNWSIWQK